MTDDDKQTYSKGNSVDLRIILIGDVGVGKKSIVQRFKLINSTETKHNNFRGFFQKKKKKKAIKKEKKSKKDETSSRSRKDTTYQSIETTEEENEEEK